MPTFRVEYRLTHPHQTKDVDADNRDAAIAKVVEEEPDEGDEISVTRAVELPSEAGATGATGPARTSAAAASGSTKR